MIDRYARCLALVDISGTPRFPAPDTIRSSTFTPSTAFESGCACKNVREDVGQPTKSKSVSKHLHRRLRHDNSERGASERILDNDCKQNPPRLPFTRPQ